MDRVEILARIADRSATAAPDVEMRVREILADVRARGDAAVRDWTSRIEKRELVSLELPADEWRARAAKVAPDVQSAIRHACERVRKFHEPQRRLLDGYAVDEPGLRCELRAAPLQRVGLYVPGGSARYPSSVVMTAVPAAVAGVRELIMVTPGPSDETLFAAQAAGVHRVFVVGGAQAVGALAFGTASVPRVDKIVGPGNAWVAEAKRQVFGAVDIDAVAGPSEILIVADDTADATLLAADLLSQAEHDREARAILLTPSARLADEVSAAVDAQLADLPRADIAGASIATYGFAVVTANLDEAIALANEYAPEHLELCVADPAAAAARVETAGAIFLGASTPEAAGDYLAGPSHVLPTGGAARYASPLGVWDFIKRTSLIRYTPEALAGHAADIERLATVEGLAAHARAVTRRR
jgi:histidinol dehydrogenase